MTQVHAIPSPVKGATHMVVSELVVAVDAKTIFVRARLGAVAPEDVPAVVDGETVVTPGIARGDFIPDADLSVRTVVLDRERYDAVFARGAARGLPLGDFGRADVLAECDLKGW